MLEAIDFEAYVNPTLTFHENLETLLKNFPLLKKYIRGFTEDIAGGETLSQKTYHEYLVWISTLVEEDDPEALGEMYKLGFETKKDFYEKLFEEGILKRPEAPPQPTAPSEHLEAMGLQPEPPPTKPAEQLPEGWITVTFKHPWSAVVVAGRVISPLRRGDVVQGPPEAFGRPLKLGYAKIEATTSREVKAWFT